MEKNARIYIAGHNGLVGNALLHTLRNAGFFNIIIRSMEQLDLRKQADVYQFFSTQRIDYVFLAAAKVGGILANATYPADFIYDNLAIALNVIDAAYRTQIKKLLFLGSSCIYPKESPQPIKEEYLLSDYLEKTNEPYAIAKIAGLKLCEAYNRQYNTNFISCMPTNLYGPGDTFDSEKSHVIPALIQKFYHAKRQGNENVVVWGTGKPCREFLFIDDLADACLFLMKKYENNTVINIGTGDEISIKELAELIKKLIGFEGSIVFDESKPDGIQRKLLQSSKLNHLGWKATTPLEAGLKKTIDWYHRYYGNK